jgi:hypothetical protein
MRRSSRCNPPASGRRPAPQHLKTLTYRRRMSGRSWVIILTVLLMVPVLTISARALSQASLHKPATHRHDRADSAATATPHSSGTGRAGTARGATSVDPPAPEPAGQADSATSTTLAPAGQVESTASTVIKPVGAGLYLFAPSSTYPFIDHAVLGGSWSEFEPGPGDFSGPGWARIDSALRDHPTYKFRLRIMAGRDAPDWVKRIGGGCVQVYLAWDNISSCVPRFWTDAYLDEYQRFMTELARRYDNQPRILDVVNSACMTTWAEPFIRAGRDAATNRRLWSAGLNEATDRHCFERSMQIHASAFQHTRVSLATHTQWQIIVNPASDADAVQPSWTKERDLLNELRSRYEDKLLVQNNGLGGNEGCTPGQSLTNATSMWCWMASASEPKGFQTEGDRRLPPYTVYSAIQQGLKMHGCFIEHNQFGTNIAEAKDLDSKLKADCASQQ